MRCNRCIPSTAISGEGCVLIAMSNTSESAVVYTCMGLCGCVLGVLFVLGNVVYSVPGVGGMYMWLRGSVSGIIICGFV